jgi:hypothetical protein
MWWCAVLLGWLLLTPLTVQAAAVSLGWTAGQPTGTPVDHYQLQRCTAPAAQASCVPSVDLAGGRTPPTVTTFTDPSVAPGSTYCWTVFAVGAKDDRKQVLPGADGTRHVCAAVTYTLPPPGPTTVQPLPVGLRLTWPPPVFAGSDATPSMLTRYDVWRSVQPATQWLTVGAVGPTLTTWDDPAATPDLAPGVCYEIRAVYHPIASVGNKIVCTPTAAPVPPGALPAPSNFTKRTDPGN